MARALNEEQLNILEEYAFYESGLSAHGCLEGLDSYTKKAIESYGRVIIRVLEREREDTNKLQVENKTLKQRLEDIKNGFEGCCYACEPVGILNQELEKKLELEHLKTEELKQITKQLYSVALHFYEIAKNPIVVVGPGLFHEAKTAIELYEKNNEY